jgi:hypothetical protein
VGPRADLDAVERREILSMQFTGLEVNRESAFAFGG